MDSNGFDRLAGLTIADGHLRAALEGREFLVFDGGMGTMIQAAGIEVPSPCPDLLCLTRPDAITAIQAQYVAAGAEVITTNTFSSNARKLEGAASVAEVYAAAARCAREAGARYVAGDIGPTGAMLEPMGDMTFDEAYEVFAEQARAAEAAGCDLIAIETMSDLAEIKAAVLAARESTSLPVFATMSFEGDGRTFLGTPPEVAATVLSGLGVAALGVNCSLGPNEMPPIVERLVAFSRVPVIVQPNAGLPRIQDGRTVYDVTPEEFGAAIDRLAGLGASILGGCCGTNPDFTRQIVAVTQRRGVPAWQMASEQGDASPQGEGSVSRDAVTAECRAVEAFTLASASQVFSLAGGSPSIGVIGERINPTGKPKLKAALREGNLDYLVGEAIGQRERGADILDVNVGLPELDEPAVLSAAVKKLAATCTLPLVIDSSDPVAIERAVRSYAGKPLINSVNGKRESLDAVLPIAAKYGCAVIGLTLDEDGIPAQAEGRFAIAERIVREAARYGIPTSDVVIDCLTMAVATNQPEAPEILRAIRMVKQRLGCRTTLGVSNISFGLPQRPLMNATFLAAALGAGLDLPILNPNAARYRDVVSCYRVLNAEDEGARGYIERCASTPDPYEAQPGAQASDQGKASAAAPMREAGPVIPVPESLASSAQLVEQVQRLILAGRKEPVAEATVTLLDSHDALDIIDGLFIPCLDEVGVRFDDGRFFLPQLMASAEAVKAGFDVVKQHVAASAQSVTDGPVDDRPIILATVKGDIHDIGKNIVKMLLENYGFRVVDLGRDVPPEAVVAAAREQNIKLVGLSALMTTTCKAMEQTVALLHEQLPDVKTFVGGAVLTPEYAQAMGADYYTKDAAASARVAELFFQG